MNKSPGVIAQLFLSSPTIALFFFPSNAVLIGGAAEDIDGSEVFKTKKTVKQEKLLEVEK